MFALWNRRQRRLRHFAMLDQQGRCRALWTLPHTPEQGTWIEVIEADLSLLGKQLTELPPVLSLCAARAAPLSSHQQRAA